MNPNTRSAEDVVMRSSSSSDSLPNSRPSKRRQISMLNKNRVRRNLFGPVDHETTDDFLRKELAILADLSNCKWNFDFSKEKPLDGRWMWEAVRPGDRSVPSAYANMVRVREGNHAENMDPRRNPLVPVTVTENRLQDLPSVDSSTRVTCGSEKTPGNTEIQGRQSTLKGFLSVTKRKSRTNLKSIPKSYNHRILRSNWNSRVKSKSPFTQVPSSLPRIASQDDVAD